MLSTDHTSSKSVFDSLDPINTILKSIILTSVAIENLATVSDVSEKASEVSETVPDAFEMTSLAYETVPDVRETASGVSEMESEASEMASLACETVSDVSEKTSLVPEIVSDASEMVSHAFSAIF